jgi:glycosyltransferase involved in cell wall biosynthesis
LRRKLGLPEQGFLILTVRRLIARMGLENLIDAMKTVHEKDPDAHLLIGGQGYLLRSLKERVSRRGLGDRVRLLGYVDDELLPEYYAASDLFVLPTLSLEGFGMVTLEALACGTPVLGSDAGATPEILRDLDPGLILEETEPESLGRAILRQREAARNTKLQAKCRSYVEENYSWEKVTDRFEKTMTEMVNRGRR